MDSKLCRRWISVWLLLGLLLLFPWEMWGRVGEKSSFKKQFKILRLFTETSHRVDAWWVFFLVIFHAKDRSGRDDRSLGNTTKVTWWQMPLSPGLRCACSIFTFISKHAAAVRVLCEMPPRKQSTGSWRWPFLPFSLFLSEISMFRKCCLPFKDVWKLW